MLFSKKFLVVLLFLSLFEILITPPRPSLAGTIPVENPNKISPYDMLCRSLCEDTDWDWKFVISIAYTESRFRTDVKSHRGATGLMQIMPNTARGLGYGDADLTDPTQSITIALELLDRIEKSFRFPESMSHDDKLSVILASYNAGVGYVLEARRVAHADGASYNKWSVLRDYITRNGTHSETEQYVTKVMTKYKELQRS